MSCKFQSTSNCNLAKSLQIPVTNYNLNVNITKLQLCIICSIQMLSLYFFFSYTYWPYELPQHVRIHACHWTRIVNIMCIQHQHHCITPHSLKMNTTKWSSKNDHILLITGCGLGCHLLKHGKKSKKFECLAAAMHEQGIVFKSRMLQDKFKGLLEAACKEAVEEMCWMGYECLWLEAKEEATHVRIWHRIRTNCEEVKSHVPAPLPLLLMSMLVTWITTTHLVEEVDDYTKMKAVSLFMLFFTY